MAFKVIICILLDRLFILMVVALLIFNAHLYIGEKDLRLIFVIPPFVHLLLKVYIKIQMLINIYFAYSPSWEHAHTFLAPFFLRRLFLPEF